MERFYSIPRHAWHYHRFTQDADIKSHPAYYSAKAGDFDAALTLVENLAEAFLKSLKGRFPLGANFASPYAKEATGDNAILLALSLVCGHAFSGNSDTDIVQLQKVFHTGADPMERLMPRPSFEGQVDTHVPYVLVDDVTSMGRTLAELANFIRINGGRIAGTIVIGKCG